MSKIYSSILSTIGNTPLVYLNNINPEIQNRLIAKIEKFNPGGSSKDRAALFMIAEAEKQELLKPQSTIIEPTSGNTGIALAMIAAVKGYKMLLVGPSSMSKERILLAQKYGAEVILTPKEEGMQGAIEKALQLSRNIKNSFIPFQFKNTANVKAHEQTTAKEILRDTAGNIDYLVIGVGTGGTITGTANILKKEIKNLQVFAVEPGNSAMLSGKPKGMHQIQGIGAGFIPDILNTQIIDDIITVSDKDAFEASYKLSTKEGLLCGISSGAVVYATEKLLVENKNKTALTILPDTGERYLSVDFAE